MYQPYSTIVRNPDGSMTCDRLPVVCSCGSRLHRDVSESVRSLAPARDYIAAMAFVHLECEQGHKRAFYRQDVQAQPIIVCDGCGMTAPLGEIIAGDEFCAACAAWVRAELSK